MKQLDVHGLTLEEAISTINKNIKIAYDNHISVLYVCHGFNKGDKIKAWCLKHGSGSPYVSKVESGINEGISNFYIKVKIR